MRIEKFRIQNYKSIVDSGYCWLASDLTVLAGKNESGKTAVLEALRDFDPDVKVSGEALHIETDASPLIEVWFRLSEDDLEFLFSVLEDDRRDAVIERAKYIGIGIIKDYADVYHIDDIMAGAIDLEWPSDSIISTFADLVTSLSIGFTSELSFDAGKGRKNFLSGLKKFIDDAEEIHPKSSSGDTAEEVKSRLATLKEAIVELEKERPSTAFMLHLQDLLPKMIMFSDFSDLLPFEVPVSKAAESSACRDFAKVAGLDLGMLARLDDLQKRRNILAGHSASLTTQFSRHWGQDGVEVIAEPDGSNLRFGVRDKGSTILYRAEQRSRGFQWFLSFFLRLQAEGSRERMILIDEPGLYLHARAQRDVLKVLEEIASDGQVIFSTHSPYLISPDRLDRVRLVQKDKGCTYVESKIHKAADSETLTPIITALGLDLSRGFSGVGEFNLVVEGMSDYYYLQAFARIIGDRRFEKVSVIACVGAAQIPQVVSILIGWGLRYAVLVDGDPAGMRVRKLLIDKLRVDPGSILTPGDGRGAIEDIISAEDLKRYLVTDASVGEGVASSKIIKDMGASKPLLARQFYDTVVKVKGKLDLTKETKEACAALIERVLLAFEL